MPLQTIYVARHGFRSSWSVDPVTGTYSASIRSPTGIPADPALTSHGVKQSQELAKHLMTVEPPIDVIYSSPYYRCLQTIEPFVKLKQQGSSSSTSSLSSSSPAEVKIRPEHGLGEFFGAAPFSHPQPATPPVLKTLFPATYDETYVSALRPSDRGETFAQLYERVEGAVQAIVERCDAEGALSIVLCSHAATVIALGRILTGKVPERVEEVDFKAFTCGLSVFTRREPDASVGGSTRGGWTCEKNSDCSFLSGGEERGWSFSGDESSPGTGNMSNVTDDAKL